MTEGTRADARVPSVVSDPNQRSTRLARVLLLCTPAVALLAPTGFLFPFVTVRAVAFRALVLLTAALALILLTRRTARFRFQTDLLFWALTAQLVIAAVSALFSAAPWQGIYGDLERMGGVIATAHLLLYYVLLRTFFTPADWQLFFRIAVITALLIAAHAAWEFAALGSITSLIGNSGIFGVYLLFHIGFAAIAARRAHGAERTAFAAAIAPLVVVLVLSQNRSSLLGLLVGAFAAALLLSFQYPRLRRWRFLFTLAPLFVLALPITHALAPELQLTERLPGVLGKLARASQGYSEGSRIRAWDAGFQAFADRPVLGYGPENYRLVWAAREDVTAVDGYNEFDRAHNAYVESLALTGLLGAAALLAVWVCALLTLRRAHSRDRTESALWLGLLIGYAVYLFFWFEDINSGILWAASLAAIAGAASTRPLIAFRDRPPARKLLPLLGLLAIAASLYLHSIEALRVARWLGVAETRPHSVEQKLALYRRAFTSPAPQTLHTAPSYVRFMLALSPTFSADRADPYRAPLLDAAFQDGFNFIDVLQQRDPRDPVHYQTEGSLALVALRFYQTQAYYDRAIAAFDRAIEASPTRLAPRFLLAETHAGIGAYDRALAVLGETTRRLGPHGDTYYYEAKVHALAGDLEATTAALLRAISLGRVPMTLVDSTTLDLARAGQYHSAATLTRRALERRLGSFDRWPDVVDTLTDTRVAAGRLPVLALKAGDRELARTAAHALARRHPSAAAAARALEVNATMWLESPPEAGLVAPLPPQQPRTGIR